MFQYGENICIIHVASISFRLKQVVQAVIHEWTVLSRTDDCE